jgi:hypothetical protein
MAMSKMFAVINNVDDTPIFVRRGEVGYWPCKVEHMDTWKAMLAEQGEAVTAAALAGSIFGWDAPIAKPAMAAAEPSEH